MMYAGEKNNRTIFPDSVAITAYLLKSYNYQNRCTILCLGTRGGRCRGVCDLSTGAEERTEFGQGYARLLAKNGNGFFDIASATESCSRLDIFAAFADGIRAVKFCPVRRHVFRSSKLHRNRPVTACF
jgi:hypothetical protein